MLDSLHNLSLRYLFGAALLCLGLAPTALAYSPIDDHYLCDYPQDIKQYRYYRWSPAEFPIPVYIANPPALANSNPRAQYRLWAQNAFTSWTQKVPEIAFVFVDQPQAAKIKVSWVEHFPESESVWGKSLYPQPSQTTGGLKHSSEVHLALKAQQGSTFIAGQEPWFSEDELAAIATHEVGHALGLPHSKDPDDLMTPYLFRLTANSHWGISQRDQNTLRLLYHLPLDLKINPCNGY